MKKILSFFAAMLCAVAVFAEPVVLPATLDVSNVSFRSDGMPDFVLEEGDYAGTYFDMGAHDSSNDTLLYAEWDVTIEPLKYDIDVVVYNENSWRVQLYLLNQAGDTVKDLRYKGSSGQCGKYAIGSMDLKDLEAGNYKLRARAATAWSKMKLKEVIVKADYKGAPVALPGTLLPAYAELSANASVTNDAIAFKPSTANSEYATWNVNFAAAGDFNVTIDITASNGHTYGVTLLSADGQTEIGAVAEAQSWDTGIKELGAITVPAAGKYIAKLTNATQWSEAVLNSIKFAAPAVAEQLTLYLKLSADWAGWPARYAIYTWKEGVGDLWAPMTLVEGEEDIYTASIPADNDKLVFVRLDGEKTGYNWDEKWSQTIDLDLPGEGKNFFTVTAGGTGNECTGIWSKYGEGGDDPQPEETKYYLVGSFNGWTASDEYLFEASESEDGQFELAVTLAEYDEFKVKSSKNVWYPDGNENNYKVDANHAGDKTVFFRPDGEGGEGWYEGVIYVEANEPDPKFYIAGSMSENWQPTIKSFEDSYTFENLEAGNHTFKVVDGDWIGFSALTEADKAVELYSDQNDNVCFTLAEAGDVKVTYIKNEVFKVEGKFVLPTVQIIGIEGWETDPITFTAAENKLSASVTLNLDAWYYEFKMIVAGAWLGKENGDSKYEIKNDWTWVDGLTYASDNVILRMGDDDQVPGDYTFTWEFATRKLTVTFPEKEVAENPWETYFATGGDWVADTQSALVWDAENGKATITIAEDKSAQWQAQAKYKGLASQKDKFYHVALKMKANHDLGGVTLKWENSTGLIMQDQTISLAANTEYAFEEKHIMATVEGGDGILVLDFGWAKAGDEIEVYDIVIEEVDAPALDLEDGYYLIGLNGWTVYDLTDADKFVANSDNDGEWMLANVTLAENDEFKVVEVANNALTDKWFPAEGGNYKVGSNQAGVRTIYFRPDYQGGEGWHYGCIYVYVEEPEEPVEGCDWDNIGWIADGSAEQTFGNQFKVCVGDPAPNVINIQTSFGTESGIYMTFGSDLFTEISLPESKYAKQGAGMLLYVSAFIDKTTDVTVVSGGKTYEFTVYNAKGQDTGTSIESNVANEKAVKMIENGQLIIIRGNEKFNAQGQVIR